MISEERRGHVRRVLFDEMQPDFDYFLLVLLASVIATEGLLIDSPTTIIGAMLVAPMMSPIIGLGLSSLSGDARMVRRAATGLAEGAILAVVLSAVVTWFNTQFPFFYFDPQDLPATVLVNTRPGPIDLIIALAGGLAAAFARAMPQINAALPGVAIATALMPPLCTIGVGIASGRWDVAGGAFLLFLTNAITIAFSSTLVFSALGFSPRTLAQEKSNPRRTLIVSGILTAGLLIPLTYLSVRFVQEAQNNRRINEVVTAQVARRGAELVSLNAQQDGDTLLLDITLRTPQLLVHTDSLELQNDISVQLQQPVELVLDQVQAFELDPKIPPTFTLTPTASHTPTLPPSNTPGPSPTPVSTATPTVVPTNTPTPTPTHTPTSTRTPTPTFTPTPSQGETVANLFPGLQLRQTPGGVPLATLRVGEPLTILYGREIVDGLVWIEVMDSRGRTGWLPEVYLIIFTPVPTAAP